MKAKIVVGLGFGDEGKGITTDYLVSRNPSSIVVRYCGGHQAGHTVVKDGIRHVFASYGSGSLAKAPTYISEHCCLYPVYLVREEGILRHKVGHIPHITIHPLAKVTTPFDIALNRVREKVTNHGSVGVGIGTTMQRNLGPHKLHAIDLKHPALLKEKLKSIERYYAQDVYYTFNSKAAREFKEIVDFEFRFWDDSIAAMDFQVASYNYLSEFSNIIFEGAQGILLDMDFGVFPHVTFGHTTSRNAISICKELGISEVEMYYVTRCYLTRHGNGWMPETGDAELINNQDETNIDNEWQGQLRARELDYELIRYALKADWTYSYGSEKHLVVTCLDQRPGFELQDIRKPFKTILGSYSPDSKDFKTIHSPLTQV